MNALLDLLLAYRATLAAVLLTVVLVLIVRHWWHEIRLFLKSLHYSLPLIGKTRRLGKHLGRDPSNGWFKSERALCSDFHGLYRTVDGDPEIYDKAASYLSKAQEIGRNEMSSLGWLLIAAIVFVEALGFAFVLAGYTVPGTSQMIETNIAFGIAFLLAVILVFVTHAAGRELHKRRLIRMARVWWLNDADPNKPTPLGATDKGITLEKDHRDDARPAYVQLINRVSHNGTASVGVPWTTLFALILIVAVAAGATYVRYQAYVAETTIETQAETQSGSTGTMTADDTSAIFDGEAPPELTEPARESESNLIETLQAAEQEAAYTTYAILALVFVSVQAMGVMLGFKFGFSGKQSPMARKIIGKHASRREYEDWLARREDNVGRVAQTHLDRLQARMLVNAEDGGVDREEREALRNSGNRSFVSYTQALESDEAGERQDGQDGDTTNPDELREHRLRAKAREIAIEEARTNAAHSSGHLESDEEMLARLLAEERLRIAGKGQGT